MEEVSRIQVAGPESKTGAFLTPLSEEKIMEAGACSLVDPERTLSALFFILRRPADPACHYDLHKGIWHGSTGRQAHGKVPRVGIPANQKHRMILFGYYSILRCFFNGHRRYWGGQPFTTPGRAKF